MKLKTIALGTMAYERAFELQEATRLAVQNGAEDTLFLLEHPKIITLGLNAKPEHLLFSEKLLTQMGYEVKSIKRGGDVTYHGPGQLIGYVIANLKKNHQSSIKKFVYHLEEGLITLLKTHFDLCAVRDPINAGVFIGTNKIAAIGLSVQRGITMHGFALNVNTTLSDFEAIVPCGLKDRGVTSIAHETGTEQDMAHIQSLLIKTLSEAFGYECVFEPFEAK